MNKKVSKPVVVVAFVSAILLGALISVIIVNRPPKVEVSCQGNNPVAKISDLPVAHDFWMQLVNARGAATFVNYSFTTPWDYDVIDGGIGDLAGSKYRELIPGWNLLWGWSNDSFWPHKISGFNFMELFMVPKCSQ